MGTEDKRNGFHIDKSVSPADIIRIAVIAIGAVAFFVGMQQQISSFEDKLAKEAQIRAREDQELQERIRRNEKRNAKRYQRIIDDLDWIKKRLGKKENRE